MVTKDAGTIVGLDMMRIINELTADALHVAWTIGQWGAQCPGLRHGRSTFDVSLLTIEDDIFDVSPLQATRILEART